MLVFAATMLVERIEHMPSIAPTFRSLALVGAAGLALSLVACAPPAVETPDTDASAPAETEITVEFSQEVHDLLPPEIQESERMIWGGEGGRAPFRYFTETGELTGIEVDMGAALGEIMGVEIVHEDVSGLAATLLGLSSERYDIAFGPFLPSAERAKEFDYVNFMLNRQSILVPEDSDVQEIPGDLCGIVVAYQENTSSGDYLQAASDACVAAGKPAVELTPSTSQEAVVLAVQAGRVGGGASASPIANLIDKQNDRLRAVEDPAKTSTLGSLASKARPELAPALMAAYEELFASGAYEAIMTKWGQTDAQVDAPTLNG